MSFVTDDVKRGIKQLRFIEDRFLNGTLDPVAVRRLLQEIIEGRSARIVKTPSWYTSIDSQVEIASAFLELHGGEQGFRPSDIPPAPNWMPRTQTEVLLLTIKLPDKGWTKGLQRTFDAWWEAIVPPIAITKYRSYDFLSDRRHLRQANGVAYEPGIRWVIFDPNTYQGKSPRQAHALSAVAENTNLASVEVLIAAAMFPEWVAGWDGRSSPYPYMAGLECVRHDRIYFWNVAYWTGVPKLDSSKHDRIELNLESEGFAISLSSCPTYRSAK
jgi:hypothetical protein